MPQGKQVSFEFGEVSPSLQFRSDAVSYSQGLGKLRNMFVRREGGVSNRSGFQYINNAISQIDIPALGGKAGIKGFTFWDADNEQWRMLEYYNTDAVAPKYKFAVDGTPVPLVVFDEIQDPTPDRIRFTQLKDRVFITPALALHKTVGPVDNEQNVTIRPAGTIDEYIGDDSFTGFSSAVCASIGNAPFVKVSYLVTAIMNDGRELVVFYTDTDTDPGNNIFFPHADLRTQLKINFTGALTTVKGFRLYRASGVGGVDNSFFKLAAQLPYHNATSITFDDYGADDPSQTPPLDDTMIPDIINYPNPRALSGVEAAAYYQQRLMMAMKPNTTPTIKSGDMLASKLGATEQIKAPVIYSDTGAFQFSVPVTDGTPAIATLAMQGLIVFTERAVYHIRGGSNVGQGVITPTSINPLLISEEGCSRIVDPVMSGSRGYFINNSNTKMMVIEFGADGNLGVGEASIFSNHLLLQDIVQMAALGGGENLIYLLRRDGKLVLATATDQGSFGFSLIETDGYIESIFRGKAKRLYPPNSVDLTFSEKYYDMLMAYVIRNGVRTLERLTYRDDKHREGEFFADAFASFGQRLSNNGNNGYASVEVLNFPYYATGQINIEGVTYLAGEVVTLRTTNVIHNAKFVLHFFYDDANGNQKWIRFISDGNPGAVIVDAPFTRTYQGRFEADVPASLQNVRAQSLTTVERNKRYTRWLPAHNQLTGAALFGPWLAVSDDPNVDGEAEVSVYADGEVVSSPLNTNKNNTLKIVRSGGVLSLDLPDFYSFGYVGAPYTAEFETLDLETADNRTLTDAQKLLNAVGIGLMETRGGFCGMPNKALSDMQEIVTRDDDDFSDQTPNFNGYTSFAIPSEYQRAGRINIKQVDPAPISILSVYPKGIAGD